MKLPKSISKTLRTIVLILYIPIYIAAFILHAIARILLSIAYAGLLNFKYSKDVILSVINRHEHR